jgi:phosphotransferase system enzyme I (PtsI)
MDDVVQQHATSMATQSAVTKSGDPVTVLINVADPAELATIDPALCDGIGLVRTEFLFSDRHGLPDEDTQYHVYRRLMEWAKGRPVTIRTLDAGGDKPIRGLTIDGESNPFLGVRGVRLSLTRPDIFRIQLRALLRASALGVLKVMVPMITVPEELSTVRAMMQEELAALKAGSIDAAMPQLGMMVEVPAAALAIDCFDAEFYSIGSNDLTQYVTAAGRDIGAVADLADVRHPGVLRLIEHVVAYGHATDREVSLCGDAAGEATLIPALLDTGLRTFSVAPGLVGRTKLAMSTHTPASPRGTQ